LILKVTFIASLARCLLSVSRIIELNKITITSLHVHQLQNRDLNRDELGSEED